MRTGECTVGCGACCKFVILQVNPAYLDAERRSFIEAHGIRLTARDGGAWGSVDVACKHLTTDLKCGVFGKSERPQACSDFPFVQSDIDLVDAHAGAKVCSYEFEEVPA